MRISSLIAFFMIGLAAFADSNQDIQVISCGDGPLDENPYVIQKLEDPEFVTHLIDMGDERYPLLQINNENGVFIFTFTASSDEFEAVNVSADSRGEYTMTLIPRNGVVVQKKFCEFEYSN